MLILLGFAVILMMVLLRFTSMNGLVVFLGLS